MDLKDLCRRPSNRSGPPRHHPHRLPNAGARPPLGQRAAIKSCDSPGPVFGAMSDGQENGHDVFESHRVMVSSLSQAEVLIALVVAAHAGVLAVRLAVSLYKA